MLGIPHYIVVGILHGGFGPRSGGLNAVLVIFASVALLFTGRYPESIFYLMVLILLHLEKVREQLFKFAKNLVVRNLTTLKLNG